MRYEQIKSIILTTLVVSSIFLTWNLWTYQPYLEPIEESSIAEDVIINSQKELRDVILPFKLLYHRNDKTYGTQRKFEIQSMMEQMSSWNIYGLTDISRMLTDAEFKDLVHGEDRVEIIFPDLITFNVYKNILMIKDTDMPEEAFDRIVVTTEEESADYAKVYFISYSNQQVYESRIDNSSMAVFKDQFMSKSIQHPEYFAYDPTERRRIYLPENELKMNRYEYVTATESIEEFVNALFSEPSLVSHEYTNIGEEFNDDSSLMRVNVNNKTFTFVNIEEESGIEGEASITNLITQASAFINDHGGWPEEVTSYQYFSVSKPQQLIHYRMFVHDLPVFNESGMTEYSVVLGKLNIFKYSRPFTNLEGMTKDTSSATLPSGRVVLERLLEENINPEQIEDIIPGFKLTNGVSSFVILEPAWYYKYAGSWIRVQPEDVGRGQIGLE
ncbi:YycH family regulatory protein [Bacillus sp. SCS-153A]|uniref:YycH family regulatory protein n=1 Tax=Rossellomorea sedimentorum TaxID=3115294 RepID=UPI0039067726